MLNPFPIQFLSLLAHAILRVAVGLILVYLGSRHLRNREPFGLAFPLGVVGVTSLALTELVLGAMFFVGWYTQVAALILFFVSLKMFFFYRKFASPFMPQRIFYILLAAVSLSLFITGAGFFAFDMPI